ncbi:nicotinate phosphoribosyltransferase [Demequina sp. NBRC 110057]|uniref:nicotinate phosphoribosyltransferase n=1 Tax=Demequina sp. NBRC 110057 TaxID=1570346 RepID=UPI000A0394B1|nr:nicotinate phosphoribosyltransferase [Demequina sp. NBRC 110057]
MPSQDAASASALTTDQYELTMSASHLAQGRTATATFDLFVRRLPPERRFLVTAGLADALEYLEKLRFTADDVDYLASLGTFPAPFLDYLREFRFTGEVWAMAEGESAFPGEPLVRVTAPLIEAQIVETALLTFVGHQTAIASKAARVALACGDRTFVDFAARRAHGPDAALTGARAAYLAGASGTSNVLAGKRYGIPLSGTMAHAYVMSHDDERDAFRAFARDFPEASVLLIDTYDTLQGARHVVEVARELAAEGIQIQGVRIDSGDLASLSTQVRAILDAGGLHDVRIVASSDLDEHRITDLLQAGAPIDAFGVGTQMGVAADAPALSAVYKLVEYDGRPVQKRSPGKASLPGRKQVWRATRDGRIVGDTVGLESETGIDGSPMLARVMAEGRRLDGAGFGSLADARERCAAGLASLPPRLRALGRSEDAVPVGVSAGLEELGRSVTA